MEHWLKKVVLLLEAETSNLRKLAEIANGNPRTFYKGTRLHGADLRGQDLRGMEFTDLDWATIQTDSLTKFDSKYAERHAGSMEPPAPSPQDNSQPNFFLNEWLRAWNTSRKQGDKVLERKLADQAEAWLQQNDQNEGSWAEVWQRVWLAEKKNSRRRSRLHKIATQKLSLPNKKTNLILIWKWLYQNADNHEKRLLSSLLVEFVSAFSDLRVNSDFDLILWRKTIRACSLLRADSADSSALEITDKLEEMGVRWLSSLRFDAKEWPAIWRELWTTTKDSFVRDKLYELARGYIDSRNWWSWYPVWKLLANYVVRHNEHFDGWMAAGIRWLGRNENAKAWTLVWRRAWKYSEPNTTGALLSLAEMWLRTKGPVEEWPAFWLFIYDSRNGYPQVNKWIKAVGYEWLDNQYQIPLWSVVWTRLYFADQEDRKAVILLQRIYQRAVNRKDKESSKIHDLLYS